LANEVIIVQNNFLKHLNADPRSVNKKISTMAEQFSLKWNNYQISLTSAFKHILEEEDFVDVTLSAEGQSLKAHKVVLSACSSYFKNLLKGISLWQHPVLVLKDVRFQDLQSILEFIYLGEVNLEQTRLDSFLNTAELLQIKGLTDGIKESMGTVPSSTPVPSLANTPLPSMPKKIRTTSLEEALLNVATAGKHKLDTRELAESMEKKLKTESIQDPLDTGEWMETSSETSASGDHILVSGEPYTLPLQISRQSYLKSLIEDLGPLHKRCPVCNMVMLKKNLSRHVRDQHSQEKPRSVCPLCGKTYKTADWLKDHIRRGHNYTKEETDELMSKIKSSDSNMNIGCGNDAIVITDAGNISPVSTSSSSGPTITSVMPVMEMSPPSPSPLPPKLEIATE